MICILAGNYLEAERWASGQLLARNEWFFPEDVEALTRKDNFHVIVVGTAGQNVPISYWDRVYTTAQQRGRVNRR